MSMPFKQLSVGPFRWSTCRCRRASDMPVISMISKCTSPSFSISARNLKYKLWPGTWPVNSSAWRRHPMHSAIAAVFLPSQHLQRKEQPAPKRRKGSLKLDPNLVPGTRHGGGPAVTCRGEFCAPKWDGLMQCPKLQA